MNIIIYYIFIINRVNYYEMNYFKFYEFRNVIVTMH